MVKRTITITTILLILSIAISLIIVLNKSSFAADDIASGTSGTCSWVIDSEGVLTIRPTDGISGTLNDADFRGSSYSRLWLQRGLPPKVTKVIVEPGVKTGTSCRDMFYNLYNCTEMDLSGLDTSNATNMYGMFCGCSRVSSLDVSNLVTTNVTTMEKMFYGCANLQVLDLSTFNMSKVTNISNMFSGSSATANSDRDIANSNNACKYLNSIGGISDWDTSSVTNMSGLFSGCASLKSLDLSTWDVSHVTSFDYIFSYCINLSNLNISTWDVSNATSLLGLFRATQSLTNLNIANWDVSNVQDFGSMLATPMGSSSYYNVGTGIEQIDLSSWDTSSASNMASMFAGCAKLVELDVSHFDMSKVTSIQYMFSNCYKLKVIDVSNWNTSSITNMYQTFKNCYEVEVLDFSHCDLSNVKNFFGGMTGIFDNCRALKKLDLHTMSNPDIDEAAYMFRGCNSLEELDISNLVTNKSDYSLHQMFYGCNSLKKVTLGENFCFKGNGTLTSNLKYAILNTPPSTFPYTGKWIREDGSYGPYTPNELVDAYEGNTMAGTWIWEGLSTNFTVSYSYTGNVPVGASNLPETTDYEYGVSVTVAPNATASGYTFSGWSRTGTFEMPGEDVTITGSFTANTDTPYIVEHYLEDETLGTYTLKETENLTGTTDSAKRATPKTYAGYTFDSAIDGTIREGSIKGDGSLVLKLYYRKNEVPVENNHKYKVQYFFDGIIDDSLEEIINAEVDSEVNITPITPIKHGEKNYTLVSSNHKITISVNDDDNIIRVYYETDALDYAIDGDVTEGDGIPDKYQIRITYKVENGNWNDGSNSTKTDIITLKDKDGNLSEDGTGKTTIPEVGSKPNEGYTKGYWNKVIPNKVSSKDDGKDFIYSYESIDKVKSDISGGKGKSSNPKTDDILNKYLLVGIGGILVLALVSKIRRKYSRKAKKIQF